MQDPTTTARNYAETRIESLLSRLINHPEDYRRAKLAAFWDLSGAANFAFSLTRDETASTLLDSAASALLSDGFDDSSERSLRDLLAKIQGWGGAA